MSERIAESVDRTAELTGLNRKTIYAGIKSGKIPSVEVGARRVLVPMWWIKQQSDGPKTPAVA